MTKKLNIVQLYPNDMNIYGDWGNVLVLKKRTEQHGFQVEIINYNIGDDFPTDPDIIIRGGGQDSGQQKIQSDLQRIAPTLRHLANSGTPMLMVCGLYQLFGRKFTTHKGEVIPGIGVFDADTIGGQKRLIGNIQMQSRQFGLIIGYENHSGQTYLADSIEPLGEVTLGEGNNTSDKTEGAVFNNVIGTYLHGSLLPKNPKIADFLIEQAARNKYGDFTPTKINDDLAEKARQAAAKRPR